MARYLVNLTNGQLDEKGLFRLFGTILNQSGAIQSGAMAVSAQSTPDMTVKVAGAATGHDIVFINSSGDTYHGWNTANENVTITSNASGVTKTDAIVAYADLAAGSATSNNPGGLKLIAVRRSGSNTGNPNSTEIQTAVGASNPYVVLAYVTVSNGASSINSGNISDQRPRAQVDNTNIEPIGVAALVTGAKVSQRVGGSATNWSTEGTTNYDTSSEEMLVQMGSALSSTQTTTANNGWFATTAQTTTFPTAYANVPLVIAVGKGDHAVPTVFSVSTTGFTWKARSNTSVASEAAIMWIAIGEKA